MLLAFDIGNTNVKAGIFEGDTWNAYVRAFEQDTFNNPALRAMWKLQRDYVDPKFAVFMDEVVERAAGRGPNNTTILFANLLEEERHQFRAGKQ